MTIAITGSTGQLGGRVAQRLAEHGVPMRLIVRDAARAPTRTGTEIRVASYDDPETLTAALRGVSTLFFVSATESPTRLHTHFAVIDAAVAAGVEHVVYTSFCNASAHSTFTLGRDHWATEERLKARGLTTTMLRDNFYIDFFALMMGQDDVIRGPAGDGRVAAVSREDVAEVAATVLQNADAHRNKVYELSGPAALTMAEVAEALTRYLGRPIRFHSETEAEAYASRASYGAPKWQVDSWVSTYTAIAKGELALVTNDVATIVGRPARGIDEVLMRKKTSAHEG